MRSLSIYSRTDFTSFFKSSERLSTVEAENYLISADMSRKKRKKVIDGVAASLILDTYLKMKGD